MGSQTRQSNGKSKIIIDIDGLLKDLFQNECYTRDLSMRKVLEEFIIMFLNEEILIDIKNENVHNTKTKNKKKSR